MPDTGANWAVIERHAPPGTATTGEEEVEGKEDASDEAEPKVGCEDAKDAEGSEQESAGTTTHVLDCL